MRKIKLRKGYIVAIIVVFVGASALPSTGEMVYRNHGQPDTVYVDDDFNESTPGWQYDHFDSIQDGVDAVNENGTVYVYNGTYYEWVNISKIIDLHGENKDNTIIDGTGKTYCLIAHSSANNVVITNLTTKNSQSIGVWISASDSIIENVTSCWNTNYGFYPRLYASNVLIKNCQGHNNTRGLFDRETNGLEVYGCTFRDNTDYGMNTHLTTTNAYIHHNNFISNGVNAEDVSDGSNLWDYNYYDDYSGEDADGNGIGDIPYNIEGVAGEQDLHPLMYPWYPIHPDTVYVNDDYNISTPGFGYDKFNRIQYGITEVPESGTVYVYNGTYYENVVIDKSITLIGEDGNNTIIDGGGSGDVIYVDSDNVEIYEFSIRNSGNLGWQNDYDAGIDIRSNYNHIYNNRIFNNYLHGLYLRSSSNNKIFSNNISNSYVGMQIVHSCNNNTIYGNKLSSIGHVGLRFYEGKFNSVHSNTITTTNYSIILEEKSNHNVIYQNLFTFNTGYAINIISSSDGNLIYHNNFKNNSINAADECNNIWNNSYPYGGNYWSDYWGDDLYSGPNQDIPGPDGIGDIPYEIPCEHGIDYYPLMNPFEQYYILVIDTPLEVREGELFDVVIHSLGGTAIPNATVEFNDELKLTNSEGRTFFTAPLVEYNTICNITASKEGYVSDTVLILIKDVADEVRTTFIFGRITNLTTIGDYITFDAVNTRIMTLFPFTFNRYKSGELITISKDYLGLLGAKFIFAFCGLMYHYPTYSMNIYSRDDAANEIIWLVSGMDGKAIGINDMETWLISEDGQPQPDAEITFNEVTGEGYVNPGDTFFVGAPSDGKYVFMLTHKLSGSTLWKSSLTHY